jgi:hypothetical protein
MTRTTLHAVVAVAVVALPACKDPLTPTTHPLLGNAYDPVNDCLGPQQSFDFEDGPAPGGTCDVVCITDAKTGIAYVTNACGPYPVADTVESADAGGDTCALALAAWTAGNECGSVTDAGDGGDGGADATSDGGDASSDAAADSPGDAPGDAPGDVKGDR